VLPGCGTHQLTA